MMYLNELEVRFPFHSHSANGDHPDRITVEADLNGKEAYQRLRFGGTSAEVRVGDEWISLDDLVRSYQNLRELKARL